MVVSRLYLCVHRDVSDVQGLAIDWCTRELAKTHDDWSRWSLAGGPATHAFMAFSLVDAGGMFRVDAQPPRPQLSKWSEPKHETRVWRVIAEKKSIRKGIAECVAAGRKWYDIPQALAHGVALFQRRLHLPEPPFGYAAAAGGIICTEQACNALKACGGELATIGARVMIGDHCPEELAQEADKSAYLEPEDHAEWMK